MRRRIMITAFLAVATVAVASFAISKQPNAEQSGRGVLSVLFKGQPVNLKEVAGRYEIGIFTKGPDILGYKVLEVGQDYVVVEDVSGVTELRIPIWSVQAVRVFKVGGK